MQVRFWGVRGSLPAPHTPVQIKSKISAILRRARPEDLADREAREHFMASLPPWLFGAVGGNTPCVELSGADRMLVFDAGSGIRALGAYWGLKEYKPEQYHIFFSHFHWDHIQGLPFFGPAYDPAVQVSFYSPDTGMEQALCSQMKGPFFPIGMDAMGCGKRFIHLDGELDMGGLRINYKKMNHPGASYSYRVEEEGKVFVYATDVELISEDFMKNGENSAFFADADLAVLDSQYTLGEAIEKYNWGHSAFSLAEDFAANWGIKHLVLFHHDPSYTDRKLYKNLQAARLYAKRMENNRIKISLAREGEVLSV